MTFQYVAEVNYDPSGTYPLGQKIDIFVDYDSSAPDEGNNPAPDKELSYELLNTIFIIDGTVIAYVRPVMNVWGAAEWGAEGYQIVNNGDGMTGEIGGQPVGSASINCGRGWTGTWTTALFSAPPPFGEFGCNGQIDFVFDPTGGTPGLTFDVVDLIFNPDGDDDGIEDGNDLCPNTASGEAVDTTGCSIAQINPCDGFKNHGKYTSAVTRTANEFAKLGLITKDQRKAIVSQASGSTCSK